MGNILQSANELMLTDVVAFFSYGSVPFLCDNRVSGEDICLMCLKDINSRSRHLVNFLFNNQKS